MINPGYKNKTNIGEKLVPDFSRTIIIDDDKLTINSKDDENFFSLIISLNGFLIDFYLNDIHLSSINKNKRLCVGYENKITDINAKKFNCDPKHTKKLHVRSNSFDLMNHNVEYVYGLPERQSLSYLRDNSYRLYNIDAFDQTVESNEPLYGSIPMLHSVTKNGEIIHSTFLNNSSEIIVDIKSVDKNKLSHWITEAGALDLFLCGDYNFNNYFGKVGKICGFAPLPNISSIGYHQSRWGYMSQDEITQIDSLMDHHKIPYDVMWLDIDVNYFCFIF